MESIGILRAFLVFLLPTTGLFLSLGSLWAAGLEEFPQSGALAVSGSVQSGTLNVPLPVGLAPGVQPPITGSVSTDEKGRWNCQVSNNTDQTLRIKVEAIEFLKGPKRGGSRSLTYRLKGGQSGSDGLSSSGNTVGYVINLTGWKVVEQR